MHTTTMTTSSVTHNFCAYPMQSNKPSSGVAKNSNKSNPTNTDIQLSKSLSWVLRHAAPSVGIRIAPDGYVRVNDILELRHPRFRKGNDPKYTIEDVIRVVENNEKQRFRLEFRAVMEREREIDTKSCIRRCNTWNNDSAIDDGQPHACQNNIDIGDGTYGHGMVLFIRANQGHSLKAVRSDQLLIPLTREQLSNPSLLIIHGTTQKAWEEHIQYEGLSRRKRNHIHFATGLPMQITQTALEVAPNTIEKPMGDDASPPIISGMRSSSEIYIYINGVKCANDGIVFYRSYNGVILTAGVNDMGMLPTSYFDKVVLASLGTIVWKCETDIPK